MCESGPKNVSTYHPTAKKRPPLVPPGVGTSMRASNLKYPKGMLIRALFAPNSEFSYLNRRPLLVISNPVGFFSTVTCCTLGSRNLPGIVVSLVAREGVGFYGGAAESVIYPWSIVTIKMSIIIDSLGMLDPHIMRAVDDAIDFHRGLNPVAPAYVSDTAYDQYYGVKYSIGEFNDEFFENVRARNLRSTSYHTQRADEPEELDGPEEEEVEPEQTNDVVLVDSAAKVLVPNTQHLPEVPRPTLPVPQSSPTTPTPIYTKNQGDLYSYITWKDKEYRVDDAFLELYLSSSKVLAKRVEAIDEETAAAILSRTITTHDLCAKLHCSIPIARQLRDYYMYLYGTKRGAKRINGKLCGRISNMKFLDIFDRIALCAYVKPEDICVNQAELKKIIAQLRDVFHISDNIITWKEILY